MFRGIRTAAPAVFAALVALIVSCYNGAAQAAGPPGDGSQPLPRYRVNTPPLAPLATPDGNTTVYQGIYRHAGYDIEVPPHWNGQLVMWAHPFQGTAPVLTLDTPEF